jgi:hypothetical protein
MSRERARQQVKRATIEAVIIRADGRRENLGIVGEYRSGIGFKIIQILKDVVRRLAP